MSPSGHPSSVKTLIIVILLLVVGIQGWFLLRGFEDSRQAVQAPGALAPAGKARPEGAPSAQTATSGTAAADKAPEQASPAPSPPAESRKDVVSIASFHHDKTWRNPVVVSFTRPVGEVESSGPLAAAPFDITPSLPGEWTWAGPYILRFKPADRNALDPTTAYTFKARPETFLPSGAVLEGQGEFTIRPERLSIREWFLQAEPEPGKPGLYVVSGFLRFSRDLDAKDAMQAVRLVDGEDKPVPLEQVKEEYGSANVLRFASAPVRVDSKERVFTLLVDKDKVRSREGFLLAEQGAYWVAVIRSDVLEAKKPKEYNQYEKGFELSFSAKVDPAALRGKLVLVPPVEGFSLERHYSGPLVLSGNFKPGATYSLTYQAGLKALDGATLAQDATFTLTVPDQRPTVKFAHQGLFLPASGAGSLALEAVNLKSARVRVERVYRNNIFFALNYYAWSLGGDDEDGGYHGDYGGDYGGGPNGGPNGGEVLPYLGERIAEFKVPTQGVRNKAVSAPVFIAEKVRDFEPGLYRLGVGADDKGSSDSKWLLITDLGIAAKMGHDEVMVWACSQKDLAPVAGARVKILSTTNQVLFQGVTDARGLWRAKGLADLPEGKVPYMVTVEKDKDYSFLQFERFKTDMTGLDVSGVEVAQAGYQAFAWGERDIYRPGETVAGMLCVRDTQLAVPPSMPVKLRWTDPQGREVAVENAKTDAQGLAAFSRAIPAHYPTGPYVLEALAGDEPIGQYRFQVEDFKPDRIATSVKPATERAWPGRDLAFSVEGRYLFGAPASGLASEAQVTLTPAPFAPKGFEGYSFGDPDRVFEPQAILQEQAALDEEGRAVYTAKVPQGLKPPAALAAMVTARVSEAGGRGVAARIKVPVDAYDSYPGLKKPAQSGLSPGQPHTFEYVVVDGQGQEAGAGKLVAELYEDRWQTVLRRGEQGGFKYETRRDSLLVERKELAEPGSRGNVTFTPPKHGSYRLALTDPASGAAARISFWASGQGYNPWAVENPARLELVPSKSDYLPGEQAKLQVRSPYPGKLLVTVESYGVLDTVLADMPANTGEVIIPIKKGYGPNVYVTAMLARKGADVLPGQAGRAFGAVSLNVAREAGRQEVSIVAPEMVKPATPLPISVKADPGSVVTLAAVDEGILQLIAQKTPDPWASFYARRALEVESFDTWALLLPEITARADKSPAGGDEDLGRYLRTDSPQGEKSVAYWSGPLTADANGNVLWTIEAPKFQGALRIMAVAVKGSRFGSAQHATRVKSPLVLLPTFPRFAQPGDSMRLPVTLRNDTSEQGRFRLTLEAGGPLSVVESARELDIAPGKEATAFFTVKAGDAEGAAGLTLKASGNGESADAGAEFPVRSPLPAVSRILSGVNQGPKADLSGTSGEGFLPGTARTTLRVGRAPLVRFSGTFDDLLGYPYGCIEQTTSKSFPLLFFASLARELQPQALDKSSPEAMVQQGISRVLSMQLPSGGFGMWPGSDREQPWASVYAAHFLVEAGKAGHQVSKEALNKALGYVSGLARQSHQGGGQKTQAYALYVLALAGRPDKGVMDHLRDKQADKLPADARALLAAAYAAVGNAKGGERLLANLAEPKAAPPGDDIFDSSVRATALMVAALVDIGPAGQETARWARELSRVMESARSLSTQEAGMAFMAMGKLYARQQAEPPCQGKVLPGGDAAASFDTSRAAVFKGLKGDGPLTLELDPSCKPGSVFYSLEARGVPQASSHKPLAEGLGIAREFLGRDGNPLDIASIKQGTVVVVKTSVRSMAGPLRNVVVSQLMPSGLEIENPRLATSDMLPWMGDPAETAYTDYRADRVNVFLDLPDDQWKQVYTLCRAVIPGSFALPPAQAEAMYYPEIRAATGLGAMIVEGGKE